MWFEAESSTFLPAVTFDPADINFLTERWTGLAARDGARSADNFQNFRDGYGEGLGGGSSFDDFGLFSAVGNANISDKGEGRSYNDDGVIVVTGTRYSRLDTYSWWDNGPGMDDYWTFISEDRGAVEREPICTCAGMTEAQRQDQEVDAEIAEILREIQSQPNQAMEYGSLIWRDSSGVLHHTPLRETPDERARFDFSTLPTLPDGRTDFSGVVAMVHTHPAYIAHNNTTYFDSDNPSYLLAPWAGDWASYDGYAALITSSGGNASNFEQYIIGWDGDSFVINEFGADDHGTTSVGDGDTVDPNTEACTCSPGS